MWDFTFDEILIGLLLAVVIVAGIVGVCLVLLKGGNKAAAKFKNENPNAATIWIFQEKFWGVKIKKADVNKVKSFQNGITDASGGTYILPGEHILTIEHFHADPAVNKSAEYKKQKVSEIKISVEHGRDYTLLFNQEPGQYSLIEGKQENN